MITSVLTLIIVFVAISSVHFWNKIAIGAYFLIDTLLGTTHQITRGLSKTLDYSLSAVFSSIGNMLFLFLFVMLMKQGLFGAVFLMVLADGVALLFFFL